MNENMKNEYALSGRIILISAILISWIMCINEDMTFKIVATVFISGVALAVSYITRPISTRVIRFGDSLTNRYLRILFYAILLPAVLITAYAWYVLILFWYDQSSQTMNLVALAIFGYTATTILMIVPYIQTLMVLAIRVIRRKKK